MCHISQMSRKDVAESHRQQIKNLNSSNTSMICTDASLMNQSQGVGAHVWSIQRQ